MGRGSAVRDDAVCTAASSNLHQLAPVFLGIVLNSRAAEHFASDNLPYLQALRTKMTSVDAISHFENNRADTIAKLETLGEPRKVENRINNSKTAGDLGVSAEVRNTLVVPFSIGRCSCVDIKQSTWTVPRLLVSFFSAGGSLSIPF